MAERQSIAVTELRLDQRNARYLIQSASQQHAMDLLAHEQGSRLVTLAASIQEEGLDPSQLLIVTPSLEHPNAYDVLEGNRRVLALKAMETPSLIEGSLSPAEWRKLKSVAEQYRAEPIATVPCIVYGEDELEEAHLRIRRRHGGAQDGAGLMAWGAAEKERYAQRHGATKAPSLGSQAITFLESWTEWTLPPGARIASTLDRMLSTPQMVEKLGLGRHRGLLQTVYPPDVVATALRHVVDDLLDKDGTKVTDVYRAEDRRRYAKQLPDFADPTDPGKQIDPVPLSELASSKRGGNPQPSAPQPLPVPSAPTLRKRRPRTTVAARSPHIKPSQSRARQIYEELCTLDAEQHRNAGAVLLRVFMEISLNHYLRRHTELEENHDTLLAPRMKAVCEHLHENEEIDGQLRRAILKNADSSRGLNAGVRTLHQYAHNEYFYPKASEIQDGWDELQPFLEAIWR